MWQERTERSHGGVVVSPQVQAFEVNFQLHTLGWKAFQDLCAQIFQETTGSTVSVYRDAQDGGQDAVYLLKSAEQGVAVSTVQCKFASDPNRRLRVQDFNREQETVQELVSKGQSYAYFFVTSMGVDAPVAADIRDRLTALGVREPHVLGQEWITTQIRASSRLRALVPRVYGLGDLSQILDERRAAQTRALLGHLMPALRVYVPTTAHRQAVRSLGEHGIVLLLGPPASGKSTLAAILATTTVDDDKHRCFQVDGPHELDKHWNPNEQGGFYWVDDAFGPNQLREDYVDQWIAIMNKVKAAISNGNRFVLTSRTHIWNAARSKLGTRNHPKFTDGEAVVNVGLLSPEEREQILYNHIKAGNQAREWKRRVKRDLSSVAAMPAFLPEIARRLGDRRYTSSLRQYPEDLIRFFAEPMSFLQETIGELAEAQQAALTLIFLHRGRMPTTSYGDAQWALISDKFGVNHSQIGGALEQMVDSFVVVRQDGTEKWWAFIHPTITDALSAILGQRPDLLELYIRGTKVETLLSEVVCADAPYIPDAIVVPNSLNAILTERVLEAVDEENSNRALFAFLTTRASEAVLRGILTADPELLFRRTYHYQRLYVDPKICLCARVHKIGMLPDKVRAEEVRRMLQAIEEGSDASIFRDEAILALIPPRQLIRLAGTVIDQSLERAEERIAECIDDADLEIDPEDNFDDVRTFLEDIENVFVGWEEAEERIAEVGEALSAGVLRVARKKDDQEDKPRVNWEGLAVRPSKPSVQMSAARSIFSDVDE